MPKVFRFLSLMLLSAWLLACQLTTRIAPPIQVQTMSQEDDEWFPFVEQEYQRQFEELDRNHDGLLEPSEVPHLAQSFHEADHNHDGRLSRAEALPDRSALQRMAMWLSKSFKRPNRELDVQSATQIQREIHGLRQEMDQPAQRQRVQKTPILLVPGYAEPSWYFMYGIYRQLKAQGWAVEGINLFPNFASAEEQAVKVKARIEEMKQRLGVKKVSLVVHSFGGLISRYYIQELGGSASVEDLVTVATPHLGTYVAYLGPGESAVQLRPNSAFIRKLNANGFVYPPVRYTSIWTNLDEIVIPPKNAIMPDSEVHFVPNLGHLSIMFSQQTYGFIHAALNR